MQNLTRFNSLTWKKHSIIRRWRRVSNVSSRQRRHFNTETQRIHSIPLAWQEFTDRGNPVGWLPRPVQVAPRFFPPPILCQALTATHSFYKARGMVVTSQSSYLKWCHLCAWQALYSLSQVASSVPRWKIKDGVGVASPPTLNKPVTEVNYLHVIKSHMKNP